jgi:hypothetical protein
MLGIQETLGVEVGDVPLFEHLRPSAIKVMPLIWSSDQTADGHHFGRIIWRGREENEADDPFPTSTVARMPHRSGYTLTILRKERDRRSQLARDANLLTAEQ